jgi:hypothetical protein
VTVQVRARSPIDVKLRYLPGLAGAKGDKGDPGPIVTSGGRVRLTGAANFYVSPTGNDATGDGTIGNPWKTAPFVYSRLYSGYDLAGQTVTIVCMAGTHTWSMQASGLLMGQSTPGQLVFDGLNSTTTTIQPALNAGYSFSAAHGAMFSIRRMTLDQTNGNNDTVVVGQAGEITVLDGINFGFNINPYNLMTVAAGRLTINKRFHRHRRQRQHDGNRGLRFDLDDAREHHRRQGRHGHHRREHPDRRLGHGHRRQRHHPLAPDDWDRHGRDTPVTMSSGGQTVINPSEGAFVYLNTNGDPAFAIKVTLVGAPFFYAGFAYANNGARLNIQALYADGGSTGPTFVQKGGAVIDTNNVGVPYFPSNVASECTATFASGAQVVVPSSMTGIAVGSAVNGVRSTTSTFAQGVTSIVVTNCNHITAGNAVWGPGIKGGTLVSSVTANDPLANGTSGTVVLSYATWAAKTAAGLYFKGTGVANGTYVAAISGSTILLSKPTIGAATGITLRFEGQIDTSAAAAPTSPGLWQSWSPTLASGTGALGSASVTSAKYLQDPARGMVFFEADIAITSNGTGASFVQLSLPVTAAAAAVNGLGRNGSNGKTVNVFGASTSLMAIVNYDNSYPVADGHTLHIGGWYRT